MSINVYGMSYFRDDVIISRTDNICVYKLPLLITVQFNPVQLFTNFYNPLTNPFFVTGMKTGRRKPYNNNNNNTSVKNISL